MAFTPADSGVDIACFLQPASAGYEYGSGNVKKMLTMTSLLWPALDFASQFRPAARDLMLETKTQVSGLSGGAASRLLGSSRSHFIYMYLQGTNLDGWYPPPRVRPLSIRVMVYD